MLLKLFSSYLSNRKQYVRYGQYVSNYYPTRSGISQGSNLGPLLFVLLINDLPDVVQNSAILTFADDIKLLKACETEADHAALQSDIDAVWEWSIANQLHFNPLKCETMTFTRSRSPRVHQYTLGGTAVARVLQVRDLGVLFDPEITFREHVRCIVATAYRRLGFVLRNATNLSPAATRALYAGLVRSVLEANAVVWSPHEDKYILMLEQVQKQFLRALYKKEYKVYPYLYPTLYIQGQLGYQSLEVRRSLTLVKFILNIIRNKIDCTALVEICMRMAVPDAHTQKYLRPRSWPVLAQSPARTAAARQAPVARARALINSVITSDSEWDLFASGIECLMNACSRVVEMNARKSTIV